MSDHAITWTHGDGEGVDATVTCTAPDDANCRLTCPAGCEAWERTGHEHGYEVVPCLAVEWWAQHVNTVECGPTNSKGEPVRNGPIDIEWDGDDWLWEYADEPSASAEPSPEAVEAAARVQWGFAAHTSALVPWEVCPEDVRERVRELAASVLRAGAGL